MGSCCVTLYIFCSHGLFSSLGSSRRCSMPSASRGPGTWLLLTVPRRYMGVSKKQGPFWGVLIVRIIVYWYLFWGSFLGTLLLSPYHEDALLGCVRFDTSYSIWSSRQPRAPYALQTFNLQQQSPELNTKVPHPALTAVLNDGVCDPRTAILKPQSAGACRSQRHFMHLGAIFNRMPKADHPKP